MTQTPAIAPAAWICLDTETGDAPEAAIQAALDAWKAPSNWKQETVNTKRHEAAERIREKAALLDASPILCCAFTTEKAHQKILNGMDERHWEVENWSSIGCGSELKMLWALREFLNALAGPETTLVGHNIRGFDLPKLRQAYIRHGLKLPNTLRIRMDDEPPLRVADTMSLVKSFSMENRDERYISLDTVARVLGINRPKQHMNGADVPSLHQQEQYQMILTYCAIDCITTARAYALMTGQAPDLQ